jgi:hypothetical protein
VRCDAPFPAAGAVGPGVAVAGPRDPGAALGGEDAGGGGGRVDKGVPGTAAAGEEVVEVEVEVEVEVDGEEVDEVDSDPGAPDRGKG